MAQDTFLNAFGMGSSLADRARNYQLQLADLALKQQEANVNQQKSALALQAQGYALQHQKEQDAYLAEDLPKVQDWQKQYLQWNANGDPTAPFPTPPSDLKSLTALKQVGDLSNGVLQSLPMAQNRYFMQQAVHQTLGQINDDVKFAIEHGLGDVVRANNGGLDDRGHPDNTRWAAIQSAIAPERKKQQDLKDLSTMSQVGGRIYIDELNDQLASGEITPERYNQLKPYARTKGGVQAQKADIQLKPLKEQGVISTPQQEEEARSYILTTGGKLPSTVAKSFDSANAAVTQLDDAFKRIQDFKAKYGSKVFDDYVGPIDDNWFNAKGKFKGLNADQDKEAQQILSEIKQVTSDYRKGLYGSALTPTEKSEMEKVIGASSRSDYLNLITGFRNVLARGLKQVVVDHRYSTDIQKDVKERYAPEIFSKPATSAPSATDFRSKYGY